MKTLISSFLLFFLMLYGIFLNSRYLEQLSNELDTAVKEIPSYEDTSENASLLRLEKLNHFRDIWEMNRKKVSLTVTVRIIEGIDDCIEKMDRALKHGEKFEFESAMKHLSRIIREIRRYEQLSLGSIL